mgnify:CR=1 FL=1
MKRIFDVTVSAVGLIVLFPLMIALGAAVKLDSPGPALHQAVRVGRGGRLFTLYKFRSMVVDAESLGPGITRAGDPRITRIGHFLRRTKLDELPQLWNVLRGDMSLVGPRPEDPRYVAHYTAEQRRLLTVRPGITSPASIAFRNEETLHTRADWEAQYLHDILPAKLAIDLEYVQNASFGRDIAVLIRTLF